MDKTINKNVLTINMAHVTAYLFCEKGVTATKTEGAGLRIVTDQPAYIIYTSTRVFVVAAGKLDINPDNTFINVDIRTLLVDEPATTQSKFERRKSESGLGSLFE